MSRSPLFYGLNCEKLLFRVHLQWRSVVASTQWLCCMPHIMWPVSVVLNSMLSMCTMVCKLKRMLGSNLFEIFARINAFILTMFIWIQILEKTPKALKIGRVKAVMLHWPAWRNSVMCHVLYWHNMKTIKSKPIYCKKLEVPVCEGRRRCLLSFSVLTPLGIGRGWV